MTYPSPPRQPESATPSAAPAGTAPPQYSADGRWYWDGQQWRPVTAQGPTWSVPYAPPDARATASVTLVGLTTAGLALFLLSEGLGLMAHGSVVDTVVSLAQGIAFFVSLAGFVGAAIAVPMWMHRCYRNLPALGATALHWSPAWAVGAWFIPVANLVLPYMVARELWAKAGGRVVRSGPLLALWWAACIVTVGINLVGNFHANFQADNVQTTVAPGAGASALFNSLAALSAVTAGGLLITIIQRITRRQRDHCAEVLGGA